MRVLEINNENKGKVINILTFAEKPENWYRAEEVSWVPGDREGFYGVLDTYRCCYTRSVAKGKHYRHLSVSIPGKKWPHLHAIYTIATLFGFTGAKTENEISTEPGYTWQMDMNRVEGCIVVVQERNNG